MPTRWLMTLGERTRPDAPTYAEDPAPDEARALALVDDFGHLFTVLREWRAVYGEELTAYAVQVEAGDLGHLPAEVVDDWEELGDVVRLDTEPGGYVKVSDYREIPDRADISARTPLGLPLWTTAPLPGDEQGPPGTPHPNAPELPQAPGARQPSA
ncbi:hypothetical protein [Streptomyces sp. N35]|uniref:hypothetical protein n=1 Tax=Streptomyces sp. N35 TaxID=2795730 RepID=UPI001F17E5DE|nr:hypothetical protein [Streptomyces sp. N35]